MKIVAASDIEAGSLRAHAINVFKTAGGLARLGHEVTVLCRTPMEGLDPPALAALYGEPSIRWEAAPVDRREPGSAARARAFADWAAARASGADVVYCRHFDAALACAGAGLCTILETHAYVDDPNPQLSRALGATRRADTPLRAVVTISPRLRDHYLSRGADPARVHVVPDGVDVEMFSRPAEIGRRPFERTHPRGHAVYAGHLYDSKGIPTVLDAAGLLPGVGFDLVGGTPEDVAQTRVRAEGKSNVRVHGMRPYAEVPRWLWHADVLLLPPSAREASAAWTSPVKLGEYLAAGAPVVASRIPGLVDWVGEPAVRWFEPDDAPSLAGAVEAALAESPEQGAVRTAAARRLAERFSYRERGAAILRAAGV